MIGVAIFLFGVAYHDRLAVLHDATFWQERPGVAPDPVTGDPHPVTRRPVARR